MTAAIIIAAIGLIFAVCLGVAILVHLMGRRDVYRPRSDGFANEYQARKAKARK